MGIILPWSAEVTQRSSDRALAGFVFICLCIITVFFAAVGWQVFVNKYTLSTTMVGSHISNASMFVRDETTGEEVPEFYPGSTVVVAFRITRYRSCKLDIVRAIIRVDGGAIYGDQERQVDHVVQIFQGEAGTRWVWDKSPLPPSNPSSYPAELPQKLAPGDYDIFSRGRYTCNKMDEYMDRFIITDKVRFKVIPRPPTTTGEL